MADAIVATNLAKRYESGHEAVRGVSFRVAAGEIVGLLGPNGAGKSTTLNMLATLVAPTSGEAWVFGHPLMDRSAVREILGVALQATGVDPMMSVRCHFDVQAALYRISPRKSRVRVSYLIDAFDLAAVGNRRAGELSGGTQRRLSLALALLHEPRVVVLDEPTVGLDPNAKRAVWSLLDDLRDQGCTILLSTHSMDEADALCERIEMIADGRIVASGTPAELKANVTAGLLQVRVRKHVDRAAMALRVASSDGLLPPNLQLRIGADVLQVQAELVDPSFIPLLTLLLEEVGVDIINMSWNHGTLDDVFDSLGEPVINAEDPTPIVTIEHRVHARRG